MAGIFWISFTITPLSLCCGDALSVNVQTASKPASANLTAMQWANNCLTNFFLTSYFNREDNMSQRLFFSCALCILIYIMSRFNSWVAEAMGVKFLAQGNNSSRKSWPGIEPRTLRLPGRCPGNLLLPPYRVGSSRLPGHLHIGMWINY